MYGRDDTPKERRRDLAGIFARLISQNVEDNCNLPGKWRVEAYDPGAIDEKRSASIMEFRLLRWPPRFRLSIHSDDGGCLVGYGVFRPPSMNRRSNDEGLREYLEACSPDRATTPVHWAWYNEMEEPLRDFSQPETLSEVEKIRRREKSKGEHAFQRASGDLVRLAEALDSWYQKAAERLADRCRFTAGRYRAL